MQNRDKLMKTLGKDTVMEMESLDAEGLRKVIVQASQAMKEVAEELENNQKYQELKISLKNLSAGKRDVNKRQKNKIALALQLLADSGQEPEVQMSEKA